MSNRTNCNICARPLSEHKDGLACCWSCGGKNICKDQFMPHAQVDDIACQDCPATGFDAGCWNRRPETNADRIARELTEKNERLAARMRHQAELRIAETAALKKAEALAEKYRQSMIRREDEMRHQSELRIAAEQIIEDVQCALAADPCEPPHDTELGRHAYAVARQSLDERARIAELEAALSAIRDAKGDEVVLYEQARRRATETLEGRTMADELKTPEDWFGLWLVRRQEAHDAVRLTAYNSEYRRRYEDETEAFDADLRRACNRMNRLAIDARHSAEADLDKQEGRDDGKNA